MKNRYHHLFKRKNEVQIGQEICASLIIPKYHLYIKTRFFFSNFFFFFFLIFYFHCASSPNFSSIPLEARTLFLNHFSNESFNPELASNLTETLRTQLGYHRNFNLLQQREEAFLWLTGAVLLYQKNPRMFKGFNNASQYNLYIACKVRLRINPKKIPSNVRDTLLLSQEFEEHAYYSENQDYIETEAKAVERMLRSLSFRINQRIENEFINQMNMDVYFKN